MRNLSDRWPEAQAMVRRDLGVTPEQFQKMFDDALLHGITQAQIRLRTAPEMKPKAIADEIMSQLQAGNSAYSNINLHYQRSYLRAKELGETRSQEDWADTWEKFRFLIFRTATAIAIAAVILGLSIVADELQVNLPARPYNVHSNL